MLRIEPLNVTAQLAHQARGNPPSTLPVSAISNCFPGLEFDFRNVWKLLFEGVELHEAGLVSGGHVVMDVTPGSPAAAAGIAKGDRLVQVDGLSVEVLFTRPNGQATAQIGWELSNGLAHIVRKGGETVTGVFRKPSLQQISVDLVVRPIFDGTAINEELAEPGALTQGLCSPWQADYRECGCFYWAASRPDFVNVEDEGGNARGHDWMQSEKEPGTPYRPDRGGFSSEHITYDQLYTEWERQLKFVLDGRTEA
ncbi:MAG: PDZ domain-containing protein [Phycisphaerales bacterium]|nr:PDZ domain-containing protein [Phycisphaerales bacterium]